MKILLLSTSARGHAMADALSKSRHKPEIISISPNRNPGIMELASQHLVVDLQLTESIVEYAKEVKPDMAVVGPENPLANGIVDALEEIGIGCMGPKQSLARVESSKGFTRDLCEKYGVPGGPKYKVFTTDNAADIRAYIDNELQGNYVVKYDALKGGKGVKISGEHLHSALDGTDYANECIKECGQVVLEEKLVGVEFSLMSFVSGTNVVHMPAVQDHKRAFEGDLGPNTGGMGTYSDANHSLPFLTDKDIADAHAITVALAKALQDECSEPFKGILYGGFIATANGVSVIEYNARFGDPEALNVLPLLKTDFVDICQSIITGELNESLVAFENKATVCKYIAPKGYPDNKDEYGQVVRFPYIGTTGCVYYGDIIQEDDNTLKLGTSRTAGIVGIGDTIEEAEQIAQRICLDVAGPVRFRNDIGTASVMQKRVDTMQQLRS